MKQQRIIITWYDEEEECYTGFTATIVDERPKAIRCLLKNGDTLWFGKHQLDVLSKKHVPEKMRIGIDTIYEIKEQFLEEDDIINEKNLSRYESDTIYFKIV